MKILTENPTLLVLKQNAYSQLLVGVILILVGIIMTPFVLSKGIVLLIMALAFALIGIFSIVMAKFITITIDKTANKINLNFKGIIGSKSQDIAIDQVAEVRISESISRGTSGTTNTVGSIGITQNTSANLNFVLVFFLKDGQGIPVPMGSVNNNGFNVGGIPLGMFSGRNKIIELGNKIAGFIGVPFKDDRIPTISDFTSAIGQVINQNKPIEQPINPTTPPTQTPTIQN